MRTLARGVMLALGILVADIASAAEIKVWAARAIAMVLAEKGAEFERVSGHRLVVVSDLPNGFLRRAQAGESFDVLATASKSLDDWIEQGRVVRDSRRDIASSQIGAAVRAGAAKPDISSVAAFRQALLDAKSIAWLKVGSGLHMDRIIGRLEVADAVEPKLTRPDTDIVCELVAKGEVELGIVVITQILTTPGVELVGPLPRELQSRIVFAAGVGAKAKSPDAAKQLIEFLRSRDVSPAIEAQGMQPAQ